MFVCKVMPKGSRRWKVFSSEQMRGASVDSEHLPVSSGRNDQKPVCQHLSKTEISLLHVHVTLSWDCGLNFLLLWLYVSFQIWWVWSGWWRNSACPRPTWSWKKWSLRWPAATATPSTTGTLSRWCWGSARPCSNCESASSHVERMFPLLQKLLSMHVMVGVGGGGESFAVSAGDKQAVMWWWATMSLPARCISC